MKHTAEPWKVFIDETDDFTTRTIGSGLMVRPKNLNEIAIMTTGSFTDEVEQENAERIVKCVNALAGIENPQDVRDFINRVANFHPDGNPKALIDNAKKLLTQ